MKLHFWLCLIMVARASAATLTVSNYSEDGLAVHGIADRSGQLLSGGVVGMVGCMTITDDEVAARVAGGDRAGLKAAFRPFAEGGFVLGGLGAVGAFEVVMDGDVRASVHDWGGRPVYLWIYKGNSQETATEHLLVQLQVTFPVDPEAGPPVGPVELALRPDQVARVFAGELGPESRDYGLGGGARSVYKMTATVPMGNLPPVADTMVVTAYRGMAKYGQLSARDINGDPLTFSVVTEPQKGVLVMGVNGDYVYTPDAMASGEDEFTFQAHDGERSSNVATVLVRIEPTPAHAVPVAYAASFTGVSDHVLRGQLQGEVFNGQQPLFRLHGKGVQHGSLSLDTENGSFRYRPRFGFSGVDQFEFRVEDGALSSSPVRVWLAVQPSISDWTWVGGYQDAKVRAIQGERGLPGATHTPGGRTGMATVALGRYSYHFGGSGYDAAGGVGVWNDLWRYDSVNDEWTCLSGATSVNASGTYGERGIPAVGNGPGARMAAALWHDDDGHLWLFGGAAGSVFYQDLWKYNLADGLWTWVGGSASPNGRGVYGTLGVAGEETVPGARGGAAFWRDPAGCLWLFGGTGWGASGSKSGRLNDLWRYDPTTHRWAWMKGSDVTGTSGVYGHARVSGQVNTPGARADAAAWVSGSALWLFGGHGYAAGRSQGMLNDLWRFDLRSHEWTWMSGSNKIDAKGGYGALGVAAADNVPGARASVAAWTAADGGLMLFGGQGVQGRCNDVWHFDPALEHWTWMKGPIKTNSGSVYGIQGQSSPSTTPGARAGASAWMDETGDAWLFGGQGFSDVWRLNLPKRPRVRLLPVTEIAENRAVLTMEVSSFGTPVRVRKRLWAWQDHAPGEWMDWATVETSDAAQMLCQSLENLKPGTTYIVEVEAECVAGIGRGAWRIFTTKGSPPVPTVEFATAQSLALESDGVVAVELRLNTPAPMAFEVPYTVSGSATSDDCEIWSSSPVRFSPGQVKATLNVVIRPDQVSEVDETLVLTLVSPTHDVALAEMVEHVLTILDDDRAPVLTEVPVSQLVPLAGSVRFRAGTQGAVSGRYQWSKDGRNLAKATAKEWGVSKAQLKDAGVYRVTVKNVHGGTSAEASLAVVDMAPRQVRQPAGTDVVLTVHAAGPGLTYQWFKDGHLLEDAVDPVLMLTAAPVAASGVYVCEVTLPGVGTLAAGAMDVGLFSERPRLVSGKGPLGYVGSPYRCEIAVANLPEGTPTRFTAKNLPKGLKLDAVNGVITGVPVSVSVDQRVEIRATNDAGISDSASLSLTFLAVPSALPGTYVGVFEHSPNVVDGMGGRLDLSVTSKGSYSARLTSGSTVLKRTGRIQISGEDDLLEAGAVIAFARKNQPGIEMRLKLDASFPTPSRWALDGELEDLATAGTVSVLGVRKTANSVPGYYTFGLELPETWSGDSTVPQGNGFGALKVQASGAVKLAGRTADGGSYTLATVLGAEGDWPVHALTKTSRSSLLGIPGLVRVSRDLTGQLNWMKPPVDASSKERAYPSGFPSLALSVVGGLYQGAKPGAVVASWPNVRNNVRLEFLEGGLAPEELAPLVFSIRNLKLSGTKQTVELPADSSGLNPAKITFRWVKKSAGQFSGRFTLPARGAVPERTAGFQGMLFRLPDGGHAARGFFLLAQRPQPGQVLKNTPLLSGQVVLESVNP